MEPLTGNEYRLLLDKHLREYPTTPFTEYEEGMLAKSLLNDGHAPEAVIEAIVLHSPLANQPGKFANGYAASIVRKSQKSLDAISLIQQVVQDFNIPSEVSLEEMRHSAVAEARRALPQIENPRTLPHFEAVEYRIHAKVLLDKNEKLNAAFDTKIAKQLLQAQWNIEAVKKAMLTASPIAKEAGRNPDNYVSFILKKAVERQAREEQQQLERENTYDDTLLEYLRQAEAARAAYPNQEFGNFQDGQIAIDMLKDGYDRVNLQRAIAEISPVAQKLLVEKGLPVESYARSVVYRASENRKRVAVVDKLQPPRQGQSLQDYLASFRPQNASAAYQLSLKHFRSNYPDGQLNTLVDTQIAKSMLQEYSSAEIEKAIQAASPVAIMPGRYTERYAGKVLTEAREQLARQMLEQMGTKQ